MVCGKGERRWEVSVPLRWWVGEIGEVVVGVAVLEYWGEDDIVGSICVLL
jgi:hypothetical protein